MKRITPLKDIGSLLNTVKNPVRYLGGEFGSIIKEQADLTFAIAFPDLYEIAMCNQAVKIIYNGLNNISSVRCERVFAPEPDFEVLLEKINIPLYTLETGIPLCETDIIGFSIGYELGINSVLSILKSGRIPLKKTDRGKESPIVIAGGCGVTNPVPYSQFFDAFFIGEVESELFDLIERIAILKKDGADRNDILECFIKHPSVWISGKKAKRAIYADFGLKESNDYFPIPNIPVIQDHGVVEIMRGCPNGCRFCHAGIYYRPQRMKAPEIILKEIEKLITNAGYREISLNSLSSGDYPWIDNLLDVLNKKFSKNHISFQLPSLKVNTFTLPLLEQLSEVRKSGLTFAIETPVEVWQMALNKEVYKERIIAIITTAKKRGWNKAKFYFMIGLPFENINEEESIVNFLLEIQAVTHIQCNVNVGTFIPKAHTPYERVKQLSVDEAEKKFGYIRMNLPRKFFKISTQHGFNSFLEGMLSRGDKRVGEIILSAFNKGCRLDPWEDYMRTDLWKEAIAEAPWDVISETLRTRKRDEKLPWDEISLGPTKQFLIRECKRSEEYLITGACNNPCKEPCGVCGENIKVRKYSPLFFNRHNNITMSEKSDDNLTENYYDLNESSVISSNFCNIPVLYRCVFSFTKKAVFSYVPHLGLIETWNKALQRSGLSVLYTNGFNPLPRLEFASSLSIGISSLDEVASCLFISPVEESIFISCLNKMLPHDIRINRAFIFPVTNLRKRESLASLLWGCEYKIIFSEQAAKKLSMLIASEEYISVMEGECFSKENDVLNIRIPFNKDRPLRDKISLFYGKNLLEYTVIQKIKTLARASQETSITDYFNLYDNIAFQNRELLQNAGIL